MMTWAAVSEVTSWITTVFEEELCFLHKFPVSHFQFLPLRTFPVLNINKNFYKLRCCTFGFQLSRGLQKRSQLGIVVPSSASKLQDVLCYKERLGEFYCTVNLCRNWKTLEVNMNVSLSHAVYLFLDFTLCFIHFCRSPLEHMCWRLV